MPPQASPVVDRSCRVEHTHSFLPEPDPEPVLTQKQNLPKVKCVLIGDGTIGKTSLVVSYTTNGYPTEYVPTAFDNYSGKVALIAKSVQRSNDIKFNIWFIHLFYLFASDSRSIWVL